MSDFAQAGLICTLQRLNDSHLAAIEDELSVLSEERPITLILPCHGAELERPALQHICSELAGATWLREIVVSMNALDASGYGRARQFFASLPQPVRILWNDGPSLLATCAGLLGVSPTAIPHGKGLNVWTATGLVFHEAKSEIVVTQDCDVASFRRASLARLCYACAHPRLGFAFAKMYYSRVTDRLYGRVSRLFLAPLLQAFTRVAGHQPMLDFLRSFRYPLAGECAMRRDLAAGIQTSPGWGLEIGMLCEVFRSIDPRAVCQVDGGSGYDHKHQPVDRGLVAMCREIAAALVSQLIAEGMSAASRETVADAYRREGKLALQRSAALALINGLPFDEAGEAEIVEAFAGALAESALVAPTPGLPAWSRLAAARPEACAAFVQAAG